MKMLTVFNYADYPFGNINTIVFLCPFLQINNIENTFYFTKISIGIICS